ncbi:MAG TPA: type II secretion system F family protein [Bryobacteraceae bacterium]|jgi:general secretion pathway protein F|nr:type II secretion system F family protein [Bryobacteraceae bacterium]
MAAYQFRAVASDGKVRTGTLTADTERVVAQELRKQGLTPVYVGPEGQKGLNIKLPSFGGRKDRDLLFFTQEISTLLNSGVPLDRALAISIELTESSKFRSVTADVLRLVKGGKSLGDALSTQPEYFSDLYVNMVRAGEAGGSLHIVFERLAEFSRTRDELRNYIKSSMVYPALLTIVGIASIIFLLTFVVPRFATIFEQSRMAMPLPTKIMLESSRLLQSYGLIFLAGITAVGVAAYTYIQSAAGRLWWDTFRLRLPVLGDALRKAETARFARAMSTLVANSVPLVQSIHIAGAILTNQKMAGALEGIAQGVKRGEGIAVPVKRAAIFPPLAGHLLTVGEETGHLDQMFARMAEIYENETRSAIKRFTALFEPLVILVLGLVVGALIISILLAITSINEVAI